MIRLGTKVPKSLPDWTVGSKTLTGGELRQIPWGSLGWFWGGTLER